MDASEATDLNMIYYTVLAARQDVIELIPPLLASRQRRHLTLDAAAS